MARIRTSRGRKNALKAARSKNILPSHTKKSRWPLFALITFGLICTCALLFVFHTQMDGIPQMPHFISELDKTLLRQAPELKATTNTADTKPNPTREDANLVQAEAMSRTTTQPAVPPQSTSKVPPPPPLPTGPYKYAYERHFSDQGSPWPHWSQCDQAATFKANCHPKPATCTSVQADIHNNHGIGNALTVTYSKYALEALKNQPDCAPILKDKMMKADAPHVYNFRLLDYVQEPTVAVPVPNTNEATKKCVAYSITRPREAVAAKVQQVNSKFEPVHQRLPLVAIHIRSGWSDELQRNAVAWDKLGDCQDYPLDIPTTPLALNEVNLTGMLLDTAHAADQMFGARNWRLYVASDAPGARRYAQYLLQERTPKIVWNDGRVGHNYLGGQTTTKEEKVETSISAFTDVLVMAQADFLVSLSSKFPRAGQMVSMCPQRFIQVPGHPRHGLAITGGLLTDSWKKRPPSPNNRNDGPWTPQLTEEQMERFWQGLPRGKDNPCANAGNPLRSCYCMLKQGHQE